MYDEFSPFDWLKFPEMQNSNYNYFSLDRIRNSPKKFLCSLPMFEYAYVLTVITAMRMGGEPTRFVDDLYNNQLNPVVAEYYKHLMKFRFIDALYKRKYESMKHLITDKYFTDAQCEIKKQTRATRAKLRSICAKYEKEHLHDGYIPRC